ncbi:MAG: YkvA family protein [Nitrospirota bacterium]
MGQSSLKEKARQLKTETYALYLAYKDPRVPLHVKIFVAIVVAYALSPIDLIPDFIPILGYIDDLIIIPAGIYLSLKMMPRDVLEECRAKAQSTSIDNKTKWAAASIIILIWLLAAYLVVKLVLQFFYPNGKT